MTAASPGVALADRPRRLAQLDGLRAVAIVLVIAHHLWPMPVWIPPLGFVGVSLFFVLSGFLITRILLDSRERIASGTATHRGQLWAFYARRALRIFPPYYALLLGLWLLGDQRVLDRMAWHTTYLSNWLFSDPTAWKRGGPDRHLWSLGVEEQFYLVWPWLVLLTPRRLLGGMFAAVILVGPAWRAWFWLNGWPGNYVNFPTPANADLLAAGGAVALLWSWRHLPSLAWLSLLFGLPMMAVVLGLHRSDFLLDWRVMLNQLSLALVFAPLTFFAARGIAGLPGRVLGWKPIAYLGVISYGMYLVHTVAGSLAWRWLGNDASPWSVAFLATGLTVVIAVASWHLFEGPINSLKRFVPYR